MNSTELKNTAKESIDALFNDYDELKVKTEQIGNDLKEEWVYELGKIKDAKDSLNETYAKISKANEEAVNELARAFEEQRTSVEKRIEHLREIYSKTLN